VYKTTVCDLHYGICVFDQHKHLYDSVDSYTFQEQVGWCHLAIIVLYKCLLVQKFQIHLLSANC